MKAFLIPLAALTAGCSTHYHPSAEIFPTERAGLYSAELAIFERRPFTPPTKISGGTISFRPDQGGVLSSGAVGGVAQTADQSSIGFRSASSRIEILPANDSADSVEVTFVLTEVDGTTKLDRTLTVPVPTRGESID